MLILYLLSYILRNFIYSFEVYGLNYAFFFVFIETIGLSFKDQESQKVTQAEDPKNILHAILNEEVNDKRRGAVNPLAVAPST